MTAYRDEADNEDWEDDVYIGDLSDDSDDGQPTVPCPYCKAEILEDSPRCPYCERYISEEDHARPTKPLWVVVTALACLAAAIWWMF
jgi:hypothetical protein